MVTTDDVIDTAVAQLNDNKIVAWMHGRMAFGARALGNRSIVASPLNPYSTENLNTFIKHREQVRKFAASVPAELCAEYFDAGPNARFLATVGRVRPAHRERFAAATVAEDRIRVHTVDRQRKPALLAPAARSREIHRTAGPLQHVLQSLWRAAGVHASGRRPQLLFERHYALFIGNFFLQK